MLTHVTPARPVVSALVVAFGFVVGLRYTVQVDATSSSAGVPLPQTTAKTAGAQELLAPRAMLDRYCVTCHNQRSEDRRAGARHAQRRGVPTDAAVAGKRWSGSCEPAPCLLRGGRGLRRQTYDVVAASLEGVLDRAAASAPNPGRPAVHRLNRTEYANVIRDLLALEIDAAALLPADDSAFGFDNNADVLTVSPATAGTLYAAARKISRLAMGDLDAAPRRRELRRLPRSVQDERASEDLPFGTRGGIADSPSISRSTAEYLVKVRLQRRRSRDRAAARTCTWTASCIRRLRIGGDHRERRGQAES